VLRLRSLDPQIAPPATTTLYDPLTRTVTYRSAFRLVLGPLAVAVFAGIQLAPHGRATAAFGAYLTFLACQAAVVAWTHHNLRRAHKRLAAWRSSRR
jgi:hypothetical protein